MNDTEKEFNAFVRSFGGTLVSDLVGKSPEFSNADYIFDKHRVVAELKCLDEDKLTDPHFMEKASKLYQEAYRKGATRLVVCGTCRVSSADFTPEYQERLMQLYEEPVRRAVKKANRQIRETKQYFGKDNYDGVLFLINENNLELSPIHLVQLIRRILSRGLYSSISYEILITPDFQATHPSHGGEYMTWAALPSSNQISVAFQQFEAALRESWIKHQEKKHGTHIPLLPFDMSLFESLINNRESKE